ncbi:MAG TPA: hypothetical protein DEH78_26630, partial [Solibacterales bacterium]|nr:hypothetical protein [Bryobacterales bacterium]
LAAPALAAPRLLLTPDRAVEIRRLAAVAGSPHEAMLRQLRAQVDSPLEDDNRNYQRAYRATSAAFLSQITGEARYCSLAYQALRDVYRDTTPESLLPDQGYGLARATVGLGFAFAYDWCRDAWPAGATAWVESKLAAALAAWPAFRHANVEAPHKGSNWVSVCRGGELIALIALRRETTDAARYRLLKNDLRAHMRNFDELGVSQEGVGYTGYGGIFLLRALLALRSIGDLELEAEAARHAWWKQAMYSGSFAKDGGYSRWLMSGVSGDGIGDEGWASLLFAFTPAGEQPYFTWWYQRHHSRFDYRREGPVWAMLYYPAAVAPRDPTPVFPKAVSGAAGLTFFRNRWQDAGDILVSFHADAQWHSHAWDQPEALQWQLFALNTLYAAGPVKTREPANFTTLLVDGRHVAEGRRGGTTGRLVSFAPTPEGGIAVADGGTQYESLGVGVTRSFEVRFLDGNRAVIRVRDEIRSAAPHRYSWQINLGDTAALAPTKDFRIGALRGRVLAPAQYRVVAEDPFRIEVDAASTAIEVEMEVGGKQIALPNGARMLFRYIPPGTYTRGSPESEAGRDKDESPAHTVTISKGFHLGAFEVTQEQ